MVVQSPTHYAQHRNGWGLHIRVNDDQMKRARQGDPSFQSSVARNYREACKAHLPDYPDDEIGFIDWEDLTFTAIGQLRTTATPHAGLLSRRERMEHGDGEEQLDEPECDDCSQCDIGHHERCRRRDGLACPQARR